MKNKLIKILHDLEWEDYSTRGTFYTKNNCIRREFIATLLRLEKPTEMHDVTHDDFCDIIDSITDDQAEDFIYECKNILQYGAGNAGYHIYIFTCYEFVKRHLEQIFDILKDYEEEVGENAFMFNKDQDYAVFLTWFVFEYLANRIINYIEDEDCEDME